jgi:hypothetical protein
METLETEVVWIVGKSAANQVWWLIGSPNHLCFSNNLEVVWVLREQVDKIVVTGEGIERMKSAKATSRQVVVHESSFERAHRDPNPGFTLYQGLFYYPETKKERWEVVRVTFSKSQRYRHITGFSPVQ